MSGQTAKTANQRAALKAEGRFQQLRAEMLGVDTGQRKASETERKGAGIDRFYIALSRLITAPERR